MKTKGQNIVFDLKILNFKCWELFNSFYYIVYRRCFNKLTVSSFEGNLLDILTI